MTISLVGAPSVLTPVGSSAVADGNGIAAERHALSACGLLCI